MEYVLFVHMSKKEIKSKQNLLFWKLIKPFNCFSSNCVYMVECQKERCKLNYQHIYIGEAEKQIETRIRQHIGYINNGTLSQATGSHFNQPGHPVSDMKFTVIEQSRSQDLVCRKEREKYHIVQFNSYYKGINRAPE